MSGRSRPCEAGPAPAFLSPRGAPSSGDRVAASPSRAMQAEPGGSETVTGQGTGPRYVRAWWWSLCWTHGREDGKAADAGRGDSHLEGLISGALGCSSRSSAGLPSLGGGTEVTPPPLPGESCLWAAFLGRGGSGRGLLAPPRAEMKAWKRKGGRPAPPASSDFTTVTQSKLPPSPRGSQRELPDSLRRSGQGSWPFGH